MIRNQGINYTFLPSFPDNLISGMNGMNGIDLLAFYEMNGIEVPALDGMN